MKQLVIFVSLFFSVQTMLSQTILTVQDFTALVVKNHPLAKQAGLAITYGQGTLLKAKGGFDPKVNFGMDQKYYNGYQYYSEMNAGLKVPTWYGIEVKTGFESNRGSYLDPQNKLPDGGLWYGGLSANLGQGMLIDQRRAELFKARKYVESAPFEQRLQLNELVYKSGYAYWNWYFMFHAKQILKDALQTANQRYEAVRRTAELGDRPQIEAVEAGIQVQNRTALLREYETDFNVASSELNMYLWNEKNEPLELEPSTLPSQKDSFSVQAPTITLAELDTLIVSHPYLKVANFKIEMLEIEKRLKKEMLKPQLNLQYNFLNEPVNYNPFSQISINNYKWGVGFEMHLFLRKERGEVALANVKIQEAEWSRDAKQAELRNKMQTAYFEWQNSIQQLQIYQQTVLDTKKLLDAERNMFENGESSLFLINAREMAFIQASLKLLELQTKNQQAALSLRFASAQLIP